MTEAAPAPLDRDAVARILHRASELADGVAPGALPDLGGGIDEQALVAAAEEVGIPVPAVRRAIAVERLGAPPDTHAADRVLGAAIVTVEAEVPGEVDEVLARLDVWLVHGHHLRRDRLRRGRGEWSKRTGLVGKTIRTVRGATGEGRLGRLRRVVATARDTGTGTCVVRIEADRSGERRTVAAEGTMVAGASAAGVFVAALVATPLLLVVAPVAVLAGVGVAASGRSRAGAIEREVERVLDAVDLHADPVRLRVDVARRVTGRVTLTAQDRARPEAGR